MSAPPALREFPVRLSAPRRWLFIGQCLITAALTVILVRSIDWRSIPKLAIELRWEFAILCAALFLVCHILNILRWRYVTGELSINLSVFVKYYGAGLFSNNFLPTGIGGDAVRVALLSSRVSLSHATASVTLDRGIGLLSLSCLVLIGWWLGLPPGMDLRHIGALRGTYGGYLAVLLGVAVAAGLVLSRFAPMVRTKAQTALAASGWQSSSSVWTGSLFVKSAGAYGYSALSNACLACAYWSAMYALGQTAPAGAAVWLVCAVSLSLLVPLTVNGLGVQEGVFVLVLSRYGVLVEAALAIALFLRLLTLLFSGLGGILALGNPLRMRKLEHPL
jgi:uncharacterized membrane protein YbhN (UPF0104 family)